MENGADKPVETDLFGEAVQPQCKARRKQWAKDPQPAVVVNSASDVPDAFLTKKLQEFGSTDLFAALLAAKPLNAREARMEFARHAPSEKRLDYSMAFDDDMEDDLPEDEGTQDSTEWLPDDNTLMEMHRQCLTENLLFLKSRGVKSWIWVEKRQILQWIFTAQTFTTYYRQELREVKTTHIPFSFANCCICTGIDPEVLQEVLVRVDWIRVLLLKFRLYSEKDLPAYRPAVFYKGDRAFVEEDSEEECEN